MWSSAWALIVGGVWLAGSLVPPSHAAETAAGHPPAAAEGFFNERVLPLLREHCFECHSHASGEASGNLMLDSWAAMTSGGSRGAAVRAGEPDASPLVKAIEYSDSDLQMPPTAPLSAEQVELIRQWVAQGAAVPSAFREGHAPQTSAAQGAGDARAHWAYQPLLRWPQASAEPPGSAATSSAGPPVAAQAETVIDAIVGEQLTAAGLNFAPLAAPAVLRKRLSYDLTGLPPAGDAAGPAVNGAGQEPSAVAAEVDRLLASPQFGERWARVWMDVARYADNKGYVFQEDREYAAAYQYRDWLIAAFNNDLPYDEFITRQLAADLLDHSEAGDAQAASDLPALGFLTLGRRFLNNRYDIIDDRIDVVARGLMGMTLACARCHDHKYDPVSQADYYALVGVFLNTEEPGGAPWPHRLVDTSEQRESHILIRGSPGNRGPQVPRRFVSLLAPQEEPFGPGSGRLELAARIVDPQNPLTARVMANRVWMQLTGTSLVESPSDFGVRCPEPKQRLLLDYLAGRLIASGWSLKSLIREIVSSRVYRQSSLHRPQAYALDPANTLYWKMNRRRLDFEAFRDTLLAVSGELDEQQHGPSTPITTQPYPRRRTVYAYIDRQNLPQVFRTFDVASPDTHSAQRSHTSVPQQGLFMLNNPFVAELAGQLALRSLRAGDDPRARAQWMFEQVLGRRPGHNELELLVSFVQSAPAEPRAGTTATPWQQLAGSLLAANELAFID